MQKTVVVLLLFLGISAISKAADNEALLGHWKLAGDCKDYSGNDNHGVGRNVNFAERNGSSAAVFNGRDSWVEIPHAESLRLGTNDFSVCAWVKPESPMRSVFGDILSKFDASKRRGLNFHLAGSSSGYQSMSDTRHVHFGIDDEYLGQWEDCGKPCPSNSLITNLVVFEGDLYAGIADAEDPDDACRVFRWHSDRKTWEDCGRLGNDPNHLSVQSMCVHEGKLYAGTGIWSKRRAWGRQASRGKPGAAKPRVFVYEGDKKWRDLGQVGETTRVICMASFGGELYVGLDKLGLEGKPLLPGKCFKYDGSRWVDCGAPDFENMESILPLGGTLYGATHIGIYRYQGPNNWERIGDRPYGISQIHTLDVYRGRLHAGTWHQGYALRYDSKTNWTIAGRLGLPSLAGEREINEINDLLVHNGKLYAGVIPKAEVYRYEDDNQWTLLRSLGRQPTLSRDDAKGWCRVTAMASYQGKLLAGTGSCLGLTEDQDPEGTLGRVYSIQAGQVVSHERDIGGGWTHLAVVRRGPELRLYVNGELSSSADGPEHRVFDISNTEPLLIGFGAQTFFTGAMSDLRLYGKAINAEDIRKLCADRDSR